MIFSEETLMAYVDGELDAETRSAVDAAIATDPQLAARVERQRMLRLSLQRTFDAVLVEPVPERLLNAARSAPAGSSAATADIANARAARANSASHSRLPRVSWSHWGVIAASILVGLLLGQLFAKFGDVGLFTTRGGQLLARGALARALAVQLALDQAHNSALQVGVSFRTRGGTYCRTFTSRDDKSSERTLAGLACNESGEWQIEVLAPAESRASAGYQMAGSDMPEAVLQALEARIAGEPLDAAAERAAREHGWRP